MDTNKKLLVLNGVVLAFIGVLFLSSFGEEDRGSGGSLSPDQVIRSIDLDRSFDFCGEVFPMDNEDVRQRLDAELLRNVYLHSASIIAIKRANAIFPIIDPILEEEGIPSDLKYLAVAESVLSNAVSPAGAKGVWQFMKGTALEYGLEVSEEVDERLHLEKSTRAACKYLKNVRANLGSWVLAAAAYNAGYGRIKQEKETQRATTFFEMNLAADETMRYPFRIVAIKDVMQHPERYEYNIPKEHLYPVPSKGKLVEVNGPIANWGDFALEHKTNYRTLKLMNPWLVNNKLTNKERKTYWVAVPE